MTTQNEDILEEKSGAARQRSRRVLLLETDERAGLVAAIADTCHDQGVSLEITTGLSHVLLTFEADGATTDSTVAALKSVPGVSGVHPYTVHGSAVRRLAGGASSADGASVTLDPSAASQGRVLR